MVRKCNYKFLKINQARIRSKLICPIDTVQTCNDNDMLIQKIHCRPVSIHCGPVSVYCNIIIAAKCNSLIVQMNKQAKYGDPKNNSYVQ